MRIKTKKLIFDFINACKNPARAYNIIEIMYEITLSAESKNINWLEEVGLRIGETFGEKVVTACSIGQNRSELCVGCDDDFRRTVDVGLKAIIANLFLGRIKYEYISDEMRTLRLSDARKKLLCHALVGFDRETEQEMISDEIEVGSYFDINGFYLFRMRELLSRWSDICKLANEHVAYLSDDETMNELIRFLVGAGKCLDCRAEIFCIGGKYRLVEHTRGGMIGEHLFDSFEELLCRLIDISPCETVLSGFEYGASFKTLVAIFDVKRDILR